MHRAPYQVLVLLFRRTSVEVEYAVLRRSDEGYWQPVAGGGEAGEAPVEAASREAFEEAGVPYTLRPRMLDTCGSVPAFHFRAREHWPPSVFVIPEHCFSIDCTGVELVLSEEHTELRWCAYDDAYARLHWDSNRTALWELRERLHSSSPDSRSGRTLSSRSRDGSGGALCPGGCEDLT